MKIFNRLLGYVLTVCILLGVAPWLPTVDAAALSIFPSETDPFVSNHYVDPTNQQAPFFDVILPQIAANIKENNTHSISPYYDEMPLANNPENFQGLGHTTYANINGQTVTAEAFYRVHNESLSDPNNGMGLLIYQCIQYKRAHPEEDVKITFSSYRTSVTASVCVLPESKYYGYMRSLYGTNYDEHGFVRISYMLTEAARMGIQVRLINQLPSYAVSQYNPSTGKLKSRSHLNFHTYYTQALETECYNAYAPGKKVSDFMDYVKVDWRVTDKTSDMQHVKSASVSHYLATDGTEHRNTVFFASANLDENNYRGCNGNNSSQSGVIISDHADLYRVNYNYMKLMSEYRGLEELFDLRKLVNERSNEQIALIRSGRGDEIPADEQVVYLGTKQDPVFELYYTPFGGSADTWDTVANPFCKYVDKLPRSEDYVEFIWNEFGYGTCNIGSTMEDMLEKAFCENPNVNNKISMRVSDFDTSAIQALNLGSEIGYRSIKSGANIHSKDIMLNYVEDGVRHRVSLLTSCNFYPIAFSYRTNSLLVINETDESGGDFYRILGEKYSYGMINNDLEVTPANLTLEVGQTYKPEVKYTGSGALTMSSSKKSVATVTTGGIITAKKSGSTTITVTDGTYKATIKLKVVDCLACVDDNHGLTCSTNDQYVLSKKHTSMPLTFEATFAVKQEDLVGTTAILGSDGTFDPALVFSLNKSGQPRVAIRDVADYSKQSVYTFKKVNVATGEKVHLAITIDFATKKMYCYVNGALAQTLSGVAAITPFEEKHNPVIGGDHRNGNATYFRGTIHSVAVWSDIRTAEEIAADYAGSIDVADTALLAAYDFDRCDKHMVKDLSANGNDLEYVLFWQDKDAVEPVTDYEYAFAVVGDTQTMCEKDPEAMESIYDWLLANKDAQKIEYVIGLGDITDDSTDIEWERANAYISKLNGKIPYVLTRGNHDDWDDFNRHLHNGFYETTVDGMMVSGDIELTDPTQPGLITGKLPDGSTGLVTREEDVPEGGTVKGDLTNSYRYFSIQGTDYLIMTLDFAPSAATLKWANSVIEAHPNHKVIAITHAYMYRDGTTIDAGDCYPPSYYSGYKDAQNGDDMWEKCFSKHENVMMVLSGHDPWQHVVYRQDKGTNCNTVTQMLIDAQYVDLNNGSTGMVAMFYFSNDGNTLTVRYYSVEKDCYGSVASQFTINFNDEQHNYKTYDTLATPEKDGTKVTACADCGDVKTATVTSRPTTFKLSKTEYTYDKKVKTPTVTVTDGNGKKLKKDTDYTVTYEAGRVLPGKYTVKITFKGKYSGTKRLYFTIKPLATSKITATQTAATITLKWNKVTGATGYRVYRYNNSTKKYTHIATVTNGTTYKVTKLSAGKAYKFKIRAYTKDDDTIWGAYSAVFETATRPKTPTLKVTSSTKKKATFTWTNVSGESGYQVYYATKKDGTYKKVDSYNVNVTKGSKSKLTSGKTYYFKVRAYKKTANGTVYGSWSKVVSKKIK